jgi:hypothetical protein
VRAFEVEEGEWAMLPTCGTLEWEDEDAAIDGEDDGTGPLA